MSYCVYLKRRQSLPVDQVAPLIASIPGLTMADGQQMVRRSRGFLMEHLELDQARHLVEQLRGLKIDAEFRQIRELAPNPGPVTIRAGRFSSDSCTVQDWKSQESTLLWEDVFLMSVTHLHALEIPESVRRSMKADVPSSEFDLEVEAARIASGGDERPETLLLDFYLIEPRLHFRVNSREFRYDYLKERLEQSAETNFAGVVSDFDRYGSAASRDEGFEAALRQHWTEVPGFTALYEVDEYHRWLLQTVEAKSKVNANA